MIRKNRHIQNNLIRPSTKEVVTECEVCQSFGNAYFTNSEIDSKTIIKQYCKKCDAVTIYKQKKEWWINVSKRK